MEILILSVMPLSYSTIPYDKQSWI